MLKIEQVTLREILLPLKESFEISSERTKDCHIFLLELKNPNGFAGWEREGG